MFSFEAVCFSDWTIVLFGGFVGYLHVIMETKGGKKSKKSSIQYESPLGYVIEDVRPHGGSEKFRTAAYSNVSVVFLVAVFWFRLNWRGVVRGVLVAVVEIFLCASMANCVVWLMQCVRKPS